MKRFANFREAYPALLQEIVRDGEEVSPRDLKTKELLAHTFMIEEPWDVISLASGRKLNLRHAAADALQVITGFVDHEWASKYNPRIINYGTHGAYGPRLFAEVPKAIKRLKQDADTRRAVVTIWDNTKDLDHDAGKTDFPCSTEIQFMIRKSALDLHLTMRANDAWFGLPYDVFAFTQLQMTVANILGLAPGNYYHHATSLHLYEKDWGNALDVGVGAEDGGHPHGFEVNTWAELAELRPSAYNAEVHNCSMCEGRFKSRLEHSLFLAGGLWYAEKLA